MSELSEQQRKLLDLLDEGVPERFALKRVGISRKTLHQWLRHDTAFRRGFLADLNAQRDRLAAAQERRIEQAQATFREHVGRQIASLDPDTDGAEIEVYRRLLEPSGATLEERAEAIFGALRDYREKRL